MESVDTQHSTELLDNLQIRTFDAFLLKGPRPSDVTPVKGFHIYNLSCPGSLVHLCPRMSLRLIQLPSIRVIDLLFHGELFERSAISSLTLQTEQTEAPRRPKTPPRRLKTAPGGSNMP